MLQYFCCDEVSDSRISGVSLPPWDPGRLLHILPPAQQFRWSHVDSRNIPATKYIKGMVSGAIYIYGGHFLQWPALVEQSRHLIGSYSEDIWLVRIVKASDWLIGWMHMIGSYSKGIWLVHIPVLELDQSLAIRHAMKKQITFCHFIVNYRSCFCNLVSFDYVAASWY